MTEQLATTISVAVAIALALVSLAYGLALGHLRHRKREARGPARPRNLGAMIFFSAAMPGGIVFLWNRPLFDPVLQIALLCILPALIGYGIHAVARRRRSPEQPSP